MQKRFYKYRHALCLHPYHRDSRSGSLGVAVFPPVGLEYIAASLQPWVERLTVLDLRQPGPLRRMDRLQRFIRREIDLLCISVNWEYQFHEVLDLIKGLPSEVTTVVGGKQATDYVEEVMTACPNLDILVRSEGEEAVAEIAQGRDLKDILGISYRRNGNIVHSPNRPLGEIYHLSYPDRQLRCRPYHFNISGVAMRGEEFDLILTARGCPYDCKFCTFTLSPWGQKRQWAARPVDSVIEELLKMSAGIVLISDENFFVKPSRAQEICQRIIDEKIEKRFVVQSRLEVYKHPELLALAARAGIKMILIGIESPHDRILKELNKGFTVQDIREAFTVLRRFPFHYHGYFIYGNVGESEEEMLVIPDFANELGLDTITYQKLRAERYSPIHELVAQNPEYFVGDDNIVYSHSLKRAGLERIARKITKRFYTPNRLLKIAKKLLTIDFIIPKNLPPLLLGLPLILTSLAGREINKKLRRYSVWRRLFP